VNKRLISKAAVAASIITFIVVLVPAVLPSNPPSKSLDFTVESKSTEFLSNVVGLDFTKYSLMESTPPPGIDAESWKEIGAQSKASRSERLYPPEYLGLVKEEWGSLKFQADGSQISIMSCSLNDQLTLLKNSNLNGSYIYSNPPAPDILGQTKNLLQRYQTYVNQTDNTDSSYLVPMQEILNNLSSLEPANVTIGNINFQISQNEGRTRIQWIYNENNITMSYKRLEFVFYNNIFEYFQDGWRFYKVNPSSRITFEEAHALALNVAQNCELRWVHNGVTEVLPTPDLSDAYYEVFYQMVPYRNDTSHTLNQLSRDPLTLYPYWRFTFHFPEGRVGCFSGINVCLWGDTKEIISCDGQQSRVYPNPTTTGFNIEQLIGTQ
jgi:hypothetical protein